MTGSKSERHLAFEKQALPHANLLFGFGMHLTRNAADASDLVQETYLKAYRFWDSYDQGTNIRAWLFRILRNSFINIYRRESRKPDTVEYSDVLLPPRGHDLAADVHNLQEQVFDNLLDDDISRAVSALSEEFRTVVILCDIEGMTYEEIARFVDCPLGTVRSRLHRGRKLLHASLHTYAQRRGYVRAELHPAGQAAHAVGE